MLSDKISTHTTIYVWDISPNCTKYTFRPCCYKPSCKAQYSVCLYPTTQEYNILGYDSRKCYFGHVSACITVNGGSLIGIFNGCQGLANFLMVSEALGKEPQTEDWLVIKYACSQVYILPSQLILWFSWFTVDPKIPNITTECQ